MNNLKKSTGNKIFSNINLSIGGCLPYLNKNFKFYFLRIKRPIGFL